MLSIDINDPLFLRECLDYEPKTGLLYWKERPEHMFASPANAKIANSKCAGKRAFTAKNGHGYLHGKICGKMIQAHRAAFMLHHGRIPKGMIDHINGDRTDNRIDNLREATPSQNQRYSRARQKNSALPYPGVRQLKPGGKWYAELAAHDPRYLGAFDTLPEAIAARRKAEAACGFERTA